MIIVRCFPAERDGAHLRADRVQPSEMGLRLRVRAESLAGRLCRLQTMALVPSRVRRLVNWDRELSGEEWEGAAVYTRTRSQGSARSVTERSVSPRSETREPPELCLQMDTARVIKILIFGLLYNLNNVIYFIWTTDLRSFSETGWELWILSILDFDSGAIWAKIGSHLTGVKRLILCVEKKSRNCASNSVRGIQSIKVLGTEDFESSRPEGKRQSGALRRTCGCR